jgi:tetratricopeptide (TPR) repeat protein
MLVQLSLAVAWLIAAARAVGLRGPLRSGARTPERDGIAAAIGVVAAFAVTSVADWNWFIPAVTLPMMLLAGWVAGRGAEAAFAGGGLGQRARLRLLSPRVGVALAVAIVTAIGAFSLVQPWRAEQATDEALATLAEAAVQTGPRKAELIQTAAQEARRASGRDPLSTAALRARATIQVAAGDIDGARALYMETIDLEPAAPSSWEFLATFELRTADRPRAALRAAGVALRMAPTLRTAGEVAVLAQRRLAQRELAFQTKQAAEKAARDARRAERRGKGAASARAKADAKAATAAAATSPTPAAGAPAPATTTPAAP